MYVINYNTYCVSFIIIIIIIEDTYFELKPTISHTLFKKQYTRQFHVKPQAIEHSFFLLLMPACKYFCFTSQMIHHIGKDKILRHEHK